MSGGGVVLNSEGMVLVVNQRGVHWSLPKGHVDDGEDAITAAKREIYEESGLLQEGLTFIKKLGSYKRFRLGKDEPEDRTELKTIILFMFHTSHNGELHPIDAHNPEARWVPRSEVANLLSHPKDKAFFLSILDQLESA